MSLVKASAAPIRRISDTSAAAVSTPHVEAFASELLLHLLDASGAAVMVVDHRGWVICSSRAAEEVIKRRDVLFVAQGRLQAEGTGGADLQRLLAAVVRTGEPQPVVIPRRNYAEPYRLMARALRPSSAGSLILLQLHDPDQRVEASDELLRKLFRLTPVESELARKLLDGLSLVEAAPLLRITTNTARTHMKSILSKTGTHRQSELVCLLARTLQSLR